LLIMPPPRVTLEEPPAIVESLSAPAYYADGRVFKDLGHNVDVLFWVWRAGEPIEQVRIRIPKQALLITPQWLPPILLVRENAHHC
jgi:hypothetical protein